MAVYFSTDTLGNRLEHEEKLRIVPKNLFNISDNYLMVTDCSYYDSDGDKVSDKWEYNEDTDEGKWIRQDVPYKHLLVRKSDGKIWCVDNISETILSGSSKLAGKFVESNSGDLYFIANSSDAAFKFNFTNDSASFEQITTGYGAISYPDDIIVTDNGIVGEFSKKDIYFGWPHSGFTYFNLELSKDGFFSEFAGSLNEDFPSSIPDGDLGLFQYKLRWDDNNNKYYWDTIPMYNDLKFERGTPYLSAFTSKNKLYIMIKANYSQESKISESDLTPGNFHSYNMTRDEVISAINKAAYEKLPLPTIYNIIPGEKPGEITFKKIASLNKWNDFIYTDINIHYWVTSRYGTDISQMIFNDDKVYVFANGYLTYCNLKNNTWEVIKELESDKYNIEFQGKLWYITNDKVNPEIYWVDLNSLQSGTIHCNVILPDYVLGYSSCKNGIITYSGVDPATSNRVYFYIDITTGEAVSEVNSPELMFETIVPLN
ncbi:MAG: hypothetical protein HDS59_03320 [Barnesiella sp.]|nr:hypothetical protein [Barnesiella sp.]